MNRFQNALQVSRFVLMAYGLQAFKGEKQYVHDPFSYLVGEKKTRSGKVVSDSSKIIACNINIMALPKYRSGEAGSGSLVLRYGKYST